MRRPTETVERSESGESSTAVPRTDASCVLKSTCTTLQTSARLVDSVMSDMKRASLPSVNSAEMGMSEGSM